jgi:hypothetical protein
MRASRLIFSGPVVAIWAVAFAWAQAPSPLAPKPSPSIPLVLAGGTVVDVTDWGRSAKDIENAVVIVRDGPFPKAPGSSTAPVSFLSQGWLTALPG